MVVFHPDAGQKWVQSVIDALDWELETGEVKDDVYEALDWLKTNYRASAPRSAYEQLEKEVVDWYEHRR